MSTERLLSKHYEKEDVIGVKEKIQREFLHLKLLMKKNVKVSVRSWVSSVIELSSPIFFILILLIISKSPAITNNTTPVIQSINIPQCIANAEDRCFNLIVSPSNSPTVLDLMKVIAESNDPPLQIYQYSPETTGILPDLNMTMGLKGGIIMVPSTAAAFDFVKAHPNVTMGGIEFKTIPRNFTTYTHKQDPLVTTDNIVFNYNLLTNTSCPNFMIKCVDNSMSITMALQNAINIYQSKRLVLSNTPSINVTTGTFPVYQPTSNAVTTYGCLFFYCGPMISFIFLMYKITYEKEKKLKTGMIMMGLSGKMYWVSWFFTCFIINVIITNITIATGAASKFEFFLSTNFFVNFFLFFLFTLSMYQLGFLISSFIQTTKAAIGIGMTIFIVGSILQLIFSLLGPLIFQILYETDSKYARAARIILSAIPMYHFSKAVTDINSIAQTYQFTGVGFKWSDLTINLATPGVDIPQTAASLYSLFILSIVFSILAWYFEQVIPGNDGSSAPPYFFILPSYWGVTKKKIKHLPNIPQFQDPDVNNAVNYAHSDSNHSSVVIQGLSKTYKNLFNSKKDVHAVKFLSLSVEKGTLLGFLGANGAGKSTTIGILTGLIEPTYGDAIIHGHSVVNNISEVRKITNVCPQHDILWPELTAYEHFALFAELKGVPAKQREAAIQNAIKSVKLTSVAHNQISTYSGGMKRRVSVAIACIGSPKIIFLDEPTTGMDSQSRRHIWNLIKEIKKNCVVILTTHLMEEADILADRIVIMANGVMACNGNSLQLKNKFGEGYSISIVVKRPECIPEVKDMIFRALPASKLLSESADLLNFGFPINTPQDILVNFFKSIEEITLNQQTSPIRDWSVSHTTLEDVFLSVAKLKHL
ncbi:hypothetical protein CYY_000302 [Polysphondylium violaceum]|uniref:ABC transporter domain-containing protein n=1 Tax=Polysphondylium violaceum TaxID=133409 RepID=A0A8J4V2K3_9MYCE|nr:hypothetical protein CYY_000302 [Polysphondylium violaceum]